MGNFEVHLKNRQHRERVDSRVALGGPAAQGGVGSVNSSTDGGNHGGGTGAGAGAAGASGGGF